MCTDSESDPEHPTSKIRDGKRGPITFSTGSIGIPSETELRNMRSTKGGGNKSKMTDKYNPDRLVQVANLSEEIVASIKTVLEGARDAITQESYGNPYVKNGKRHYLYALGYHWTVLNLAKTGARVPTARR